MTKDSARSAADISPRDRIAVIAGSGALPVNVVEALVNKGCRPFVVAVEGEADVSRMPPAIDSLSVTPEELGRLLPRLKREGVTHLVMAGGIARRPRLTRIRLAMGILLRLPRFLSAYARGDDGLLKAVVSYVEENGIAVVGAHEIVPDLLTPAGVLTRAGPRAGDRRDVRAAIRAARTIGALDVGQAAVAIGGRAIALEGIEGTDGLLERTRGLRDHGRLAGKKRGVLAKCAKPAQELRADLPTIGPATVSAAHAAGLAGVAVEAGHSFILDFDRTVAQADELGLFVLGFVEGEDDE